MTEELISPQEMYDNPCRFAGVMGFGLDAETGKVDLSLASSVHSLMEKLWPDWPDKLSAYLKEVIACIDGRYIAFYSPTGSKRAYPVDVTEFITGVQ